jgi:hypothetical protein
VTAGTILHFDHPEIAVEGTLSGDRGVYGGLFAFGKNHPDAGAGRQVEASLEQPRAAVERVQLDEYGASGGVAPRHDKGGDVGEPEPCEIGRDPDMRGEAGGHDPRCGMEGL